MSAESSLAVQDGSGAFFDRIAPRYDLVNRIISLGVDQRWRREAVRALELPDGGRALDLATGTADLAIRIARAHDKASVVGVDPSAGMLAIGRDKIAAAGLDDRVTLEEGDAQALPFEDDAFDGTTIAFGIRNVPDRPAALREMARVTRLGGRVAVLELSEPRSGILGPMARFHIHEVVPRLGALLSGAREYQYLQRSIAAFPPPDEFAAICEESGLSVRRVVPLTFGVACLYVAEPRDGGAA